MLPVGWVFIGTDECPDMGGTVHLVKLGGSLITDKSRYQTLAEEGAILRNVARELSSFSGKLIIVTGAGSFGHVAAKSGNLKRGLDPTVDDQMGWFSRVVEDVHTLNRHVREAFNGVGMNMVPFSARTLYRWEEGELRHGSLLPIERALECGLTPVLYGDLMFNDTESAFQIISGDDIMRDLAQHLECHIGSVIFATDVDGMYANFSDDTTFINRMGYPTLGILRKTAENSVVDDVTGGIIKKVEECLNIAESGITVGILNGLKDGVLLDALNGNRERGSWAEPGNIGEPSMAEYLLDTTGSE